MIFGPTEKKVQKWRDERNTDALVKALSSDNPEIKAIAIEALGHLRVKTVNGEILKGLTHPISSRIREESARALGLLQVSSAIEPLIKALNDDVPAVRLSARQALQSYGAGAYPQLRAQLSNYYHETIRETCRKMLIDAGARAVETLIDGLKNGSKGVREESALLLGEIGDSTGRDYLISALGDRRIDVRMAAAQALKKIGYQPERNEFGVHFCIATDQIDKAEGMGPLAIKPLVAWLTCRQMMRRRQVAVALRRLDWRPRTRQEAAEFWGAAGKFSELVKIGPDATDTLIRLLSDENVRVKKAAARTLKRIGVPAQVRQLVRDIEQMADFTFFSLKNGTFNLERLGLPKAEHHRGKLFILRVEDCDDAQAQHVRKLYPDAEVVSEQSANTM